MSLITSAQMLIRTWLVIFSTTSGTRSRKPARRVRGARSLGGGRSLANRAQGTRVARHRASLQTPSFRLRTVDGRGQKSTDARGIAEVVPKMSTLGANP